MKTRLLSFMESQALLHTYQIPIPKQEFVQFEYVLQKAETMGYPLVLKLVSSAATHKAEKDMVIVNIKNAEQLQKVLDRMKTQAKNLPVEGFLLQEMLTGGVEVLVGTILDEQFGQAVVFGSGGTLVELFQDTSLRILPLNIWQIEQMINKTRISKLLDGFRGHQVDRSALVQVILNIARLAHDHTQQLVSLDINPLIVMPEGAYAVELRIFVREEDK
jgi:acetyltransferase